MNETELLDLMSELGALQRGHFQLSSGLHSDTYFQCARLLQFPELARELGAELGRRLDALKLDFVISPALGGILIGHEVARAVGRRFLFTERQDGRMVLRRGFEITEGEKGLLVEDVVTLGTSLREVMRVVEEHGGRVIGLAAILDRTGAEVDLPLPLISLARVAVANHEPQGCPLCAAGEPLVKPGSRGS
jgi:orotate phosphoribosyltransferase